MAKSRSSKSRKKKLLTKRMSVVLGVVATLAVYLVCNFVYGQLTRIVTEPAQQVTISYTISAEGIAVRNETVMRSEHNGVMLSAVENGGRVYKGETVANVFSSEASAQAYLRINEIDESLEEFENMSTAGAENATAIDSLDKMINNSLASLSGSIYCGDIDDALDVADDLLYVLNKSQIATGQVDNFDSKVSQLQSERAALAAQYSETPVALKSTLSGYFINDADGYETLLNSDILDGLTPERLEKIMESHADIEDPSVIGKIADDYKWHLVCVVTADEAKQLKTSATYTIYLPYSEAESIRAELCSITQGEDEERALLTFKCSYMGAALASFRMQPIVIEVNNFTGLGISKDSIVYKEKEIEVTSEDGIITNEIKEMPGVFILWGNEVRFRYINEIYRDGDTVVCSVESTLDSLEMYDDVIINKESVYEGKIVNIA